MGQFIEKVKKITDIKPKSVFANIPLNKIKELYISFKAICDTFAICLSEFEQIFSSNESAYQFWDTDNNGLIDGLELFTGLALFADARVEDKVACTQLISHI